MKIKRITIENYRNFSKATTIDFNDEINFIVGENNIGKSNLLKLLDKIFNSKYISMFLEEDFNNTEKPIVIELQLKLDSEEDLGIFEDNFSPENTSNTVIVNIKLTQTLDEEVEIVCTDTDNVLNRGDLKKFNLFYINSVENRNTHITFDRKNGIDGSLNLLLESCLEATRTEITNDLEKIKEFENLEKLLSQINTHFSRLYISDKHGVKIDFNDLDVLIRELFILKEKNGMDLKFSGQGMKSLLYLELAILYKLFKIKKEKTAVPQNFESIIIIDEPEVHLHNYQQRCFVNYILNTFKFVKTDVGENKFRDLIKELFGIDALGRQIFIATHSPEILKENYKEIIRLYKNKDETRVISGEKISFSEEKELKHYFQHLDAFKESFFSKGVLICEGDTDLGFLKSFFKKKKIDVDELGLSVIKAGSWSNIPLIKKICVTFGISVIAIRDKDTLTPKQILELEKEDIYVTDKATSEDDYIANLNKSYFESKAKEIGIFEEIIKQKEKGIIKEISDEYIFNKLNNNKDVIFKFKCAECLDKTLPSFDKVIEKAILKIKENE